jgi:hypothetical protein
MSDPAFIGLLIHTCDIQIAGQATASDDSYGHETSSYADPETKANLPCRLAPLSSREMVRLGMTSTAANTYSLYLQPSDVPSGLSMREGMGTHRVMNVRRSDGTVYDPGPFDIVSVVEPSAMGHHVKLMLNRTSGEV